MLKIEKPSPKISFPEAEQFPNPSRSVLPYLPQRRKTAASLAKHPWFVEPVRLEASGDGKSRKVSPVDFWVSWKNMMISNSSERRRKKNLLEHEQEGKKSWQRAGCCERNETTIHWRAGSTVVQQKFQAASVIQRTNKTYELCIASGATKASIRWVIQFIILGAPFTDAPTKLVWKKITNEEDAQRWRTLQPQSFILDFNFLSWAIINELTLLILRPFFICRHFYPWCLMV